MQSSVTIEQRIKNNLLINFDFLAFLGQDEKLKFLFFKFYIDILSWI